MGKEISQSAEVLALSANFCYAIVGWYACPPLWDGPGLKLRSGRDNVCGDRGQEQKVGQNSPPRGGSRRNLFTI
jgi:hypothetical protein